MRNFIDINAIDKNSTLLLIDASLQAYAAFSEDDPAACQSARIQPPPGYEFVDYWTGVDAVFGKDRTIECYGVVLRSQTAPYTYIFAFRGTSSILDVLDDLGAEWHAFLPFDPLASPHVLPAVEVEAGFYDVYSENDRQSGTPSMQQQVFALVDKYQGSTRPISRLYITGHSLGAALSELFTLDMALSRPGIEALNINFACPRIGNGAFAGVYASQPAQQTAATRTLRVQNTYDKVPCVPLKAMGYQHVADALLVAFYEESWDGKYNLLARHSANNYRAVLQCAAGSESGCCICAKLEVPANGYAVTSRKPDPNTICSLF